MKRLSNFCIMLLSAGLLCCSTDLNIKNIKTDKAKHEHKQYKSNGWLPSISFKSYKTLLTGIVGLSSINQLLGNVSAETISEPCDTNNPHRNLLGNENLLFINAIGGGYSEQGYAVGLDDASNILISGYTQTGTGSYYEGLAIKQNPDATIVQAKAFGENANSKYTYLYGIFSMADRGIGLMGYSSAYSNTYNVLAIKLSSNWTLDWAKSINFGVVTYGDFIYSGISTNDGGMVGVGYYVLGGGGYYGLIVKLNSAGDRVWSKYLSYSNPIIYNIIETINGDLAIAGTSNSFGPIIGKLNSGGGISWLKRILNSGGFAQGVAELNDGSFGFVGSTTWGDGAYSALVGRTDSYGNLLWINAVGGLDSDYGNAISATNDGGMVIGGRSNSFDNAFGTTYAGFVFKLDIDGNLVWAYVIGGGADDSFQSVKELSNSQLILTGYSKGISSGDSDAFSVKLNAAGKVLDSCASIVQVYPTVTNISSSITFDWASGYTYAEVVPSIYNWNITMRDASPFLNQLSVCESTPVPTLSTTTAPPTEFMAPTIDPTLKPTISPSLPTQMPTDLPSGSPFMNPTFSPTKNPTLKPTSDPTLNPTKYPTKSPTYPTLFPTAAPSYNLAPIVSNPIPSQIATIGTTFEFFIPEDTFYDPNGDMLLYTLSLLNNAPLPTWLNYIASTKKLIGTPTVTDIGNLLVKVTATDTGGLNISEVFTILVKLYTKSPTKYPSVNPTKAPSLNGPTISPSKINFTLSTIGSQESTVIIGSNGFPSGADSYSSEKAMVAVAFVLGGLLIVVCGGIIFYCYYKNHKLEKSLFEVNQNKANFSIPTISTYQQTNQTKLNDTKDGNGLKHTQYTKVQMSEGDKTADIRKVEINNPTENDEFAEDSDDSHLA